MGSCASHPITTDDRRHSHSNSNGPPNPIDVACVGVESRHHHKLKDFITASVLLPHSGSSSSTDESFFDAQPWIESDCDEDFFSVDGDSTPSPGIPTIHRRFSTGTPPLNSDIPRLMKVSSTPSRSNTPLHVIFAAGTPHSNDKEQPVDDKKMRLLELFRLSRGGFADERFLSCNKSSGTTSTPVSRSPFTSAAAASVCSSKSSSNASSKCRRSIKAVHPIDCLRKLSTRRHKNEKKIDAKVVGEQCQ